MRIASSLSKSLLDYLDGSSDPTEETTASVLPSGTYTGLAAAKYIKDNDKDNDGKLSADEVSISAEAYARLDADGDGKVTRDELKKSLSGDDDTIFQYYANGGAKSSKDLTSELLTSSGAAVTASGNYANLAASRFVKDKDKNGDGKISLAESGLEASAFTNADADTDGSVTLAELKNTLAGQTNTYARYYRNGGTASLTDLTSRLLGTI